MSQIVLILIHQRLRSMLLGVFQISFMKIQILGFHCCKYPSEKPSCPSTSADESFISHNRSIVNFTDNIFQDAEILSPIPCESLPPRLSVTTSIPICKSQRFKVCSTDPFHLVSDAELFSLATCSDDESSEADVISLPPDDSLTTVQLEKCKSLLSNKELFSLAMEINDSTEEKTAENCSASEISNNESISFQFAFEACHQEKFHDVDEQRNNFTSSIQFGIAQFEPRFHKSSNMFSKQDY